MTSDRHIQDIAVAFKSRTSKRNKTEGNNGGNNQGNNQKIATLAKPSLPAVARGQ